MLSLSTDPGFVVDVGSFLDEQVAHVDVTIVSCDVQRCKSTLL